jgi:citrate lyase gamma subunit
VSTEAEELHRIISTSVRDMLDSYRIQASAGRVTDKALEEIIFRANMASFGALRRTRVRNGSRCCQAWCGCC